MAFFKRVSREFTDIDMSQDWTSDPIQLWSSNGYSVAFSFTNVEETLDGYCILDKAVSTADITQGDTIPEAEWQPIATTEETVNDLTGVWPDANFLIQWDATDIYYSHVRLRWDRGIGHGHGTAKCVFFSKG